MATKAVQATAAVRKLQPTSRGSSAAGTAADAVSRTDTAADAVVVAAGPWVGRLVPDLSSRVTPSRQVVVYLRSPEQWRGAWEQAPMVLDIGDGDGIYVVPDVVGTGIKVGDHSFSLQGNPDRDRQAGDDECARILSLCGRRFRDASDYHVDHGRSCFYTVEPDEHFIVEAQGQGLVMTGFSGHGFKFGSLMGLAAAEALCDRERIPALTAWAAGRDLVGGFTVQALEKESA